MRYYRIGEFAKLINKSPQTLRNWDKSGVLKPAFIAEEGRKFYSKEQLDNFLNRNNKLIIGYCRVNSYYQTEDLSDQVAILKTYMENKGYEYQIISEIGSGLKYNRKGLNDLLIAIADHKVGKIVAYKRDSLVRYGLELIENLCKVFGCDIEYIEESIDTDDYCSDITYIMKTFNHDLDSKKAEKAKRKIHEVMRN